MAALDAATMNFEAVFGSEIVNALPQVIKDRVSEKWNSFQSDLETQRLETEKEKVHAEQQCIQLECDLNNVRQKLESYLSESEDISGKLDDVRRKYRDAQERLTVVEEANSKLRVENGTLSRERDNLMVERSDLSDLAERRQAEVDRLSREWKNLSEQLIQANNAKCEAQVKAEEVHSKELSLQYKEKRLEEERNFLNAQIANLTQELDKKNDEILQVRRDQTTRYADLLGEVAEKTEDLRVIEAREESLKADNESLQSKLDELTSRLKEARESEIKLEENFRQELKAQTKLAELYKNHCDDTDAKTNELTKAVEDLQGLLKKSSEQYGKLEEECEQLKKDHKEEITKRNEAIRTLKKELDDANGLLKAKSKGLTEEGIENLSPSAAAACKILKSGVTLTQIYSQLVAVNEELIVQKDENQRLNTYLDQILAEIEERAPMLKQQRDDYEQAVTAVNALTEKLEEAREELDLRRREADEFRRRFNTAARENERMNVQNKDLGQQVTVLLREVEAARRGQSAHDDSQSDMSPADADSIISDRLVSFRDVAELQQQNAKLLGLVRELSAKQEAAENQLVEEKTSQLKAELEAAVKQIEELRSARQRQENMVESIIQQRDMYKTMASSSTVGPTVTSTPAPPSRAPTDPSPVRSRSAVADIEKRAIEAEAALKEIKKDFDEYRTEKCENERLLSEQLEKTRDQLTESRTKAAKLASQEEYNTERFKIAQNNATSYKKQASLMEEKSRKMATIIAKHEQTITHLKNEVLSLHTKQSKAEAQLERLHHERNVLKAAEARLLQEREILHREKTTSGLVMENLKQIQLTLEQSEEETKMRLQNQNDSLAKEVALLRKKVDGEQENYKESVKAWERGQAEMRAQVEEAKVKESAANDRVEGLQTRIEELKAEVRELQGKLELAETRLAGRSGVAAATPEGAKVGDLELLLNQSKNEIKLLKEQLNNAKQAEAQFKQIAESAENRLAEGNVTTKAFREELENKLKMAEAEKNQYEDKVKALEAERNQLLDSNNRMISESTSSDSEIRGQLRTKQIELQQALEDLSEAKRVETECRETAKEQTAMANEFKEKYEREHIFHTQDIEALNALREKMNEHSNVVAELEEAKMKAEASFNHLKASCDETQRIQGEEYKSLKDQFAVVEKENSTLHEQLRTITQQMSSIQSHLEAPDDVNRSFTDEDVNKSNEKMMQIIKYLRREKEILTGKVEVLQAESARIRSQLEHSERQAEETHAALAAERERASSGTLSSAKHYELLKKVETMSALTDSNRLLREENQRLDIEVTEAKAKLNEANSQMEPLHAKTRDLETQLDTMKTELVALKAECTRWRQRTNQLVEKNQKINPDELKRLQTENATFTKQVATLQAQLKQQTTMVNSLTQRLRNAEEKYNNDMNAKQTALTQKTQEVQNATKSIQALTVKSNNLLKQNAEQGAQMSLITNEKESLKKELEETKANDTKNIEELKQELEALKKQIAEKDQELQTIKVELQKQKQTVMKLKQLGRNYKEKHESAEKEMTQVKEELNKLKEEHQKCGKDAPAGATATPAAEDEQAKELQERLDAADELLEAAQKQIDELEGRIRVLEPMAEKVKESGAALKEKEDALKAQEEQFKNYKVKTTDVLKKAQDKIEVMKEQIKQLTADNEQLRKGSGGDATTNYLDEIQKIKAELESMKAESESTSEAAAVEKEKLLQEIETLKQEVHSYQRQIEEAAKTPPSSSQTSQPKKQQSVPPTRQLPPSASIRPIPMQQQRGSTKVSVSVMPTSTSQSGDIPQVSVQPTIISVGPSTSSVTTLNPAATEFVPSRMVNPEPGPSTSSSATASVAPTPKRPREEDETTEAGKKQKTTAATPSTSAAATQEEEEDVVVLESSEEEEGQLDEEVGDEEEENYDEEEENDEDMGDEEEEEAAEDEENVEEDEEVMDVQSPRQAAEESTPASGSTAAIVPESEPSSSSPRSRPASLQRPDRATRPAGYEDQGDSVVPSTPKLMVPRGRPGEVSSPAQVPTSDTRFVFGQGGDSSPAAVSSSSGLASQEALDRTAMDIAQFAAATVPEPETATAVPDLQSFSETVASPLGEEPPVAPSEGVSTSEEAPPTAPPTQGEEEAEHQVAQEGPSGSSIEVVTSSSIPVGQPISTVSSEPQRGRGPRLTRTPIIWDQSPTSASAPSSANPFGSLGAFGAGTRGGATRGQPVRGVGAMRGSKARRSRPGRGGFGGRAGKQ